MNIPILYSDADLVAVDKPPGISVHDAPGPGGSLVRTLKEQLNSAELFPVHRLDKDASGVLLFAKTKEAARLLERVWSASDSDIPAEQRVVKTYRALCEGVPERAEMLIDAPILENQTGKPERLERALDYFKRMNPGVEVPPLPAPKTSAVHPAGRTSQTKIKLIHSSLNPKISWIEIQPFQGRMHQIRVHLAHAGHPLLVDALYGNRTIFNISELIPNVEHSVVLERMPLHAYRLSIPSIEYLKKPAEEPKRLVFESLIPPDISAVLTVISNVTNGKDMHNM